MKLNHINNANKNLQEKMRFFADYFSFANEYLGKIPEIPFDNQLSLIEKSIFQIENNFEYCPLYIINYLTELFTFHKDFLEPNTVLIYQNIEDYLKELKEFKTRDRKEWLNKNPDFLKNLKLLSLEYADENQFEKNCLAIMNIIKCTHPIKKHKKEIEYRTRIMISQFRFKGHNKESLDTYISRIISKDENQFPFPVEIIKT